MREVDCRGLLCLQQNFAKMLKPGVQAVVTASCSSFAKRPLVSIFIQKSRLLFWLEDFFFIKRRLQTQNAFSDNSFFLKTEIDVLSLGTSPPELNFPPSLEIRLRQAVGNGLSTEVGCFDCLFWSSIFSFQIQTASMYGRPFLETILRTRTLRERNSSPFRRFAKRTWYETVRCDNAPNTKYCLKTDQILADYVRRIRT